MLLLMFQELCWDWRHRRHLRRPGGAQSLLQREIRRRKHSGLFRGISILRKVPTDVRLVHKDGCSKAALTATARGWVCRKHWTQYFQWGIKPGNIVLKLFLFLSLKWSRLILWVAPLFLELARWILTSKKTFILKPDYLFFIWVKCRCLTDSSHLMEPYSISPWGKVNLNTMRAIWEFFLPLKIVLDRVFWQAWQAQMLVFEFTHLSSNFNSVLFAAHVCAFKKYLQQNDFRIGDDGDDNDDEAMSFEEKAKTMTKLTEDGGVIKKVRNLR